MDIAQRLDIENECRKLATLYCFHIDHLNRDAFAALWAEDGVYSPMSEPESIVGRAAILAWINAYPASRLGRHVSTNQIVEVIDEDTAVGTSYALVFREEHPAEGEISTQTTPRSIVEYVDEYRRTPKGWKFAERAYRVLFLEDSALVRMKPRSQFPTAVGSLPL